MRKGSERAGKYQVAKLVKTRGIAETRGGAKGFPLSLPNLESVSPIRESSIFPTPLLRVNVLIIDFIEKRGRRVGAESGINVMK